jgi:hypothetical protein
MSVRIQLSEAGIHVVQTSFQAPNANAYAERFVRSIKQECLNRLIPLATVICGRRSRHTSRIVTANGIIRDWTTRSSTTAPADR